MCVVFSVLKNADIMIDDRFKSAGIQKHGINFVLKELGKETEVELSIGDMSMVTLGERLFHTTPSALQRLMYPLKLSGMEEKTYQLKLYYGHSVISTMTLTGNRGGFNRRVGCRTLLGDIDKRLLAFLEHELKAHYDRDDIPAGYKLKKVIKVYTNAAGDVYTTTTSM